MHSRDAGRRPSGFTRAGPYAIAILANAVSSLGNISLTVAVARTESAISFGQYAVAGLVYALAVGLPRAGISESVLATPRSLSTEARGLVDTAKCALLLGGLSLGLGLASHSSFLMMLALSLVGQCCYAYLRTIWISRDRQRRVIVSDLCYSFITILVSVATIVNGLPAQYAYFIWAMMPSVLLLALLRIYASERVAPSPTSQLRPIYVLDYLAGSGSGLISMNALAPLGGTVALGALRGAGALLGPVNIIASSMKSFLIPRLGSSSGGSVVTLFALIATSLPFVGFLTFMPDDIGVMLLGETWTDAEDVLLPVALDALLGICTTVGIAGQRALDAGRQILITRCVLAVVRLLLLIGGWLIWGIGGAAWALPISTAIGALAWWIGYRAAGSKLVK